MSGVRSVVLDNEAVQTLLDPHHRKHRRAMAMVEAVTARALRRAGSASLVVPTAVRVEAGWDRRAPGAAPISRLRAVDAPLDRAAADCAAHVRRTLGVSVVDAHLATVVAGTPGPVAILTSDVADLQRIASHLDSDVTVVPV